MLICLSLIAFPFGGSNFDLRLAALVDAGWFNMLAATGDVTWPTGVATGAGTTRGTPKIIFLDKRDLLIVRYVAR